MPDPALRFSAHPLAIVSDILRQPSGTLPLALYQLASRVRPRVNRRIARKPRRDLDHRLVDQDRHGVQVAGVGFQPQSLRLQR